MKTFVAVFFAAAWLNLSPSAAEAPPNFAIHDAPKPVPEISFENGDGESRTLADFRGRVVLLNVWATWCVPCREEMPTLDRLQAKLGGSGFEVVALSIDRAGPAVVSEFFAEIGMENIDLYIDPSGKALFALGIVGLPATLLINPEGDEIGRLIGPAEWDSPEMIEFIRSKILDDRER